MESIGKRILMIRKKLKLTQVEFASQFGLSHSHISNIERERLAPTETLLLFIVEKYNVNYEWLKFGNGSMFGHAFDIQTDEGLLVKNKEMLQIYKNLVNRSSSIDLFDIVESFGFFVSIVSSKDLNNDNRKLLLDSFYDILNNLEDLVFHAYAMRLDQKVIHDDSLLDLKLEEEVRSQKIMQDIKELCNAYLREYGSQIRF